MSIERAELNEFTYKKELAQEDYRAPWQWYARTESTFPGDENSLLARAQHLAIPSTIYHPSDYMDRAYVCHKLGDQEHAAGYLRPAEAAGEKKEDLLADFSRLLGKELPW